MRCFLLLLVLPLAVGCAADRQSELLEARLREQQDYAAQLASQLERAKADLMVANQESNTLRQQLVANGKQPLQPEQADVLYRMAKLQIDQFQSSIIPVGNSGRALINMVLTPVDQFNEPIKLPGDVTIKIFAQQDSLLETHRFSAEQVRKKWNAGWVSSGFVFQLPWPDKVTAADLPGQQIELKATFKTADGREFEATHQLKIKADLNPQGNLDKPVKQADFDQNKASSDRIDTSDRRTIDEFPILR